MSKSSLTAPMSPLLFVGFIVVALVGGAAAGGRPQCCGVA
jgi:hypothetical protein